MIKFAFLLLFLIGVLIIVNPIVVSVSRIVRKKQRNRIFKRQGAETEEDDLTFDRLPGMAKLKEALSIAQLKVSPYTLMILSLIITILVSLGTYIFMKSPVQNIVIGVLFGTSPFLYVWLRVQKMQQNMATTMIPTVQAFIGTFTESENLVSAIYKASHNVPFEVRAEWNRLVMDLETGEDTEKALIKFANRVGNEWAHDFIDILIIHLDTGANIITSLFKLVNEMQNSQYNEEKKVTLLAIYRYGTLLLIGLAIFVVAFNCYMDPNNRYYYFEDAGGRRFVTLSAFVLFVSFVSALMMGRKKI